jgi:phosphohistidine swiveling domain-containing protein
MALAQAPESAPAFPLHWDDPADAELTWEMDPMHSPAPVNPLGQSLQTSLFEGFLAATGEFGLPFKAMHRRYQNYYQFERAEMVEPPTPEAAEAGGRALEETFKREIGRLGDRWENEHLPRINEIIGRYIAMEGEAASASLPEIASILREFETIRAELWTIHFRIVIPMMLAIQAYDEFYADLFGGVEGDSHALLVGQPTQSVAAGIGLSDLAIAARNTGLDQLIIDTPAGEVFDALRSSDAGRAFLEQLDGYLDDYGYRSDLFDVMTPLWRETPAIPMATIRSYLISGFDARADHEAKVRSAEEALSAARARIAGYPEPVRQQFEAMVAAARLGSRLQEDHNFYLDQLSVSWTRLIFLRIGNRLTDARILSGPDDVFMLRIGELRDLLEGASNDADHQRVRALVAERWAGFKTAHTLTPPPFLGPPPQAPPMDNIVTRGMARFWGGPPQEANAPGQLKGNAGSRGVATGEAFIAHNLSEATGLKPGQVLVATTTMPAWTPLFGIAAAIVTETGGPLSHCAIVAREYGIPAVVGAAGAMRAIEPGQVITVDGDRGIVLLEPAPLPA